MEIFFYHNLLLGVLLTISIYSVSVFGAKTFGGRYYHYNSGNERVDSISPAEEEKLIDLYGRDNFGRHKDQFLQFVNTHAQQQEEPVEHEPQQIPIDTDYLHQELDKVRLQSMTRQNFDSGDQHSVLTKISQPMVNRMIRNLLTRLEMLEMNPLVQAEPTTTLLHHCAMEGLWVSTVKGVAIHLEPHVENSLKLRVLDMPRPPPPAAPSSSNSKIPTNEETPFVTSDWVGSAHLSTEVPTTISIILQEKLQENDSPEPQKPKNPKTAVFVGQCMICNGLTAIQGTWTVFPEYPVCFKDAGGIPGVDLLYLL